MINSNERKLSLSGWLQENNQSAYNVPLKLQKFLFLYEAFSKADKDNPDFDHLRGYERGPVFSNVWGDYTNRRTAFNKAANENYQKNGVRVNETRAKKCSFIVSTLSEKELSELTHRMNIWSAKRDRIMSKERQVSLDERDFNAEDENVMRTLDAIYPDSMVQNSAIVPIDDTYFVLSKEDYAKLTEERMDTLATLAANEKLHNPVFVEFAANGGMIVD